MSAGYITYVDGQIVRHRIDQVGNSLTAHLEWCATHLEPVWVYGDGSWECPHTRIVEWDTGDHVITEGPWAHDRELDDAHERWKAERRWADHLADVLRTVVRETAPSPTVVQAVYAHDLRRGPCDYCGDAVGDHTDAEAKGCVNELESRP